MNLSKTKTALRARDYLNHHYRDGVRMEDLCRELDVGLRTVQRCFHEYFRVSPSTYLKLLRLYKAHHELKAGNPATRSVTDVAMNHGFRHLGRFSVEYRECFGETPSETLRH